MKAITVKQPWAWAIATGAKTVENRTRPHPWRSAVGERIAIHAGKGWDDHAYDDGSPMWPLAMQSVAVDEQVALADLAWRMLPSLFPRGAVIATAVLADVHDGLRLDPCCTPWGQNGPVWHLTLREVQRFGSAGPVPCRGYQGLWTLPADVEQVVLDRQEARSMTAEALLDERTLPPPRPAALKDEL